MRTTAILIFAASLLVGTCYAEETSTSTTTATTPSTQTDPAAMFSNMKQRREAWRQLSPEQRRTRMQSARSQAQTLRNQTNTQ